MHVLSPCIYRKDGESLIMHLILTQQCLNYMQKLVSLSVVSQKPDFARPVAAPTGRLKPSVLTTLGECALVTLLCETH
jgi:hypothetical protein